MKTNAFNFLPLVAALALLGGCATPVQTSKNYFFFPPPPNEPHLQYLTGFNSESQFRGGEQKTLMTFLTGERPPNLAFSKPYGAAAGNKKLYFCDTDYNAVLVVDLLTKHFLVLGAAGEGALSQPLNISVDADGNLYVADVGRNQVVIYNKDGGYMSAIGKMDELKPRDVVADQDRIYVADLQKHGVRVYDKQSHNWLFDIPHTQDATNHARAIFTPTNLAMDKKGRLYVSDTGAFRVQVYDRDGNYLRSVGEMGDSLGQFARVKGVAVDHDCRLYAVDAMSRVVQVFDESGKMLTWFAQPGEASLVQTLPAKVAIDYDDVPYFQNFAAPGFKIEYLVIVVNQIGQNKINVYGYGEKK